MTSNIRDNVDEPLLPPDQPSHKPETSRLGAELRDAVRPRAVLFMVAVALLSMGYILSYLGAFHSPTPHRMPLGVVAPQGRAALLAQQLNALPDEPVHATAVADRAAGRSGILERDLDAVIVMNPAGTTDTLLVASAGGPAVSVAATEIATRVAAAQGRQVNVVDILPPDKGDGRGMSSFYVVFGWVVGGYLAAVILGLTAGARPANTRRACIRLVALAVYAVVVGLGGAVIAGPVLGALGGSLPKLWAIGTFIVFATGATTMALQVLFGLAGVGLAILVLVVLGNPSAGGPYPAPLLPAFWRFFGQALPPGAGTTLVRNTVYFSGHATTTAILVLAAYALGGALLTVLVASRRRTAADSAASV